MKHISLYILTLLAVLASCSDMHDPDLHIKGQVTIQPEIRQDVRIDMMWETDWQSRWQMNWDTLHWGDISYTQPESYWVHYLEATTHATEDGRYIINGTARVNLDYGYYDLLVYNNDYSAMRLTHSDDWQTCTATTSENASVTLPDSLGVQGTTMEMPEQLFSVYNAGVHVSDNLDDYEYIASEGVYVLRLKESLLPRTFFYLVQLNLLHNHGRVNNTGGMTIDGVASGVDLFTGINLEDPVSHYLGGHYQDQLQEDGDTLSLIGGRMTTFGLCGINPWKENESRANGETRALTRADIPNRLYILLLYANGSRRYVTFDITEQMQRQLTGGVINVEIDVDLYPPRTETGGSDGSGGGFNVDVGDWNTEDKHISI